MERKVGQIIISQRTPYSKIRVFEASTNRDMTDGIFCSKIIDTYKSQMENPEKYFTIIDNTLCEIKHSACKDIELLFVPEGITIIKESAFEGSEFKHVSLPTSLKIIEKSAFAKCPNLKMMDVPDSVELIGVGTFAGCNLLEFIKLPNNLKELETGTFERCHRLRKVILPDSIEKLNQLIFYESPNIQSINVPKNLNKTFATSPFAYSGITSLDINYDLECEDDEIELLKGTSIRKLVIDKSVSTISANIFKRFGEQIKDIEYNGSKEEFRVFKINNEQFIRNLPNLRSIDFSKLPIGCSSIRIMSMDGLFR